MSIDSRTLVRLFERQAPPLNPAMPQRPREQRRTAKQRVAVVALLTFLLVGSRGSTTVQAQFGFPGLGTQLDDAIKRVNSAIAPQVELTKAADVRTTDAIKVVGDVQQKAIEQAPKTTQAQLEEAQKVALAAKATAQSVAIVPDAQKKVLDDALAKFNASMRSSATLYSTISITIVVAGLLLSLAAAIASFLSWPKLAGIVSLIVAAIIGLPKGIPVTERAAFFRILDAQSASALTEYRLRISTSVNDYQESARQLAVLTEYAGAKYPDGGNIGEATKDLMNDLKTAVKPPKAADLGFKVRDLLAMEQLH